ncbi:E3 ubiquitin-protein ligase TRIM58-like [Tiliqua scincoides]|uniref:E3 ubiquitin-protein ligase TRIM58-like n=1 Tax=Tiliqua scincoides TaxID=71010 RepID=UPI003461E632
MEAPVSVDPISTYPHTFTYLQIESMGPLSPAEAVDICRAQIEHDMDMSLDPATAHPSLVVSKDGKSVQYRGARQELPDNMERFDTYIIVLGSKQFPSGKHYWEVGASTEWDLGVCRGSVSRKGQAIMLSPRNGFWRMWLRKGDQCKVLISCPTPLPISVKPTRVGIFLDYSEGEVSFYNVTEGSHMYAYIGAFYVPLRPFFSPSRHRKGEKADPSSICPVIKQDTTRSKETRDKTQKVFRH